MLLTYQVLEVISTQSNVLKRQKLWLTTKT